MKCSTTDNIGDQLTTVLSKDGSVAFAYLYGSRASGKAIKPESDIDIAVFFSETPRLDKVYALIKELDGVLGDEAVDLLVLNECDDFVLRKQVLKGTLVYCRDQEAHAGFFSWTLRMYEDEMLHAGKYFPVRTQNDA